MNSYKTQFNSLRTVVSVYCLMMALWDVDIRSDSHIHYNKYLSSLEYYSQSGKLSVPEEH
jgi:hypothetical protein